MTANQGPYPAQYPVQFTVEYPDRPLNRLTSFCKHSAHSRVVMGSAGFAGGYGGSAGAGGRQGLPSMRSHRTA
jgi:hypothetical protein